MNKGKIADRIGYRFHILMALSGVFEEEFAANLGVSIQKINSYKCGSISKADAELIVEFLKENGICCFSDWLLYGLGDPPGVARYSVFDDSLDTSIQSSQDLVLELADYLDDIKKELSFFLNLHPDAKFLCLRDDFLGSNFARGDIVAGVIEKNYFPFIDDYILFNSNNQWMIGKFLKEDLGRSDILLSDQTIAHINLKSFAKIIWHRCSNERKILRYNVY